MIFSSIWYFRTPQPINWSAQMVFARETAEYKYYNYKKEKKDDELKYWAPIALKGNAPAQLHVAEILYQKAAEDSTYYAHAVPFLIGAANKGLPLAQNALGVALRNGLGVQQDRVEAWKWFMLSARQGIELAKKNMQSMGREMTASDLQKAKLQADLWIKASAGK